MKSIEIICPACGADTFVRQEPEYDGFTKVGEKLFCANCGHEFANEKEIPFKAKTTANVFSDDDKSKKTDVFSDDEKKRNCRHCKYYTVNPFTQYCALRHKHVEATDICDDFAEKTDQQSDNKTPGLNSLFKDTN